MSLHGRRASSVGSPIPAAGHSPPWTPRWSVARTSAPSSTPPSRRWRAAPAGWSCCAASRASASRACWRTSPGRPARRAPTCSRRGRRSSRRTFPACPTRCSARRSATGRAPFPRPAPTATGPTARAPRHARAPRGRALARACARRRPLGGSRVRGRVGCARPASAGRRRAGRALRRTGALPHGLAAALDGAIAEARALVLDLAPLSEAEAAVLVGDGAAAVYARAGGNPFYLEQLARAGAAGPAVAVADDAIPAPVAAALAAELAALGEDARRLLQGAAVAGDPFAAELAAAVADLPDERALPALDELLGRTLVRPARGPRRFAFRHPVVRHAVYVGTPGGWRLGAHARAARELEQRGAGPVERAHHVEHAAARGDAAAAALLAEAAARLRATAPGRAAGCSPPRWRCCPTRTPTAPPSPHGSPMRRPRPATPPARGRPCSPPRPRRRPRSVSRSPSASRTRSGGWGRTTPRAPGSRSPCRICPPQPSLDRIRLRLALALTALTACALDDADAHRPRRARRRTCARRAGVRGRGARVRRRGARARRRPGRSRRARRVVGGTRAPDAGRARHPAAGLLDARPRAARARPSRRGARGAAARARDRRGHRPGAGRADAHRRVGRAADRAGPDRRRGHRRRGRPRARAPGRERPHAAVGDHGARAGAARRGRRRRGAAPRARRRGARDPTRRQRGRRARLVPGRGARRRGQSGRGGRRAPGRLRRPGAATGPARGARRRGGGPRRGARRRG